MKAVLFLFIKENTNTIIRALKKPAALIGYILFFGFYLWLGIKSGNQNSSASTIFNANVLYVILAVITLLQTVATSYPDKKSGISGYRMSDVNILFQAPIKTFDILLTLILRQLSAGFFTLLVFLAQAPMIKFAFSLSTEGIILYMLSTFISIVVNSFFMVLKVFLLRNRPKAKLAFKIILLSFLGILFLYPVIPALSNPKPVEGYLMAFKSPYLDLIPIVGWMRAIGVSPLTGVTPTFIISLVILACICFFGLFYLSRKTDTEWFEESVQVAEKSGLAMEEVKKGVMPAISFVNKKKQIHFRFTGQGSVAILQKHFLEYRKTGFWFVDLKSFLFLILGIGFGVLAYKLKEGDEKIPIMLASLIMVSFIAVLFSMFSRWKREARSPYLYLIPDTPFRKLIMITSASAIKHFIDGLLAFVPLGIMANANILEILFAAGAYTILNQCFVNTDILGNRIFGKLNASNFKFLINYFLQLVIMIPAIAAGVVLATLNIPPVFVVMGYFGVVAVFYITLSIFAAGVLRCPEYFE